MHVPGTACITGGASGIGRACGVEFAKNGSRGILIADINLDAAIQAAEEARAVATHPQFRAEAVQVDVAQHESVKRACDRMIELFGRMDYCIHAAGVPGSKMVGIADSDYDDFKRVNSINVDGTYLVLRAVSAVMKAQEPRPVESSEDWRGTTRGAIVVMASLASLTTVSGMAAYNTSKHAVMGLTKTAAADTVFDGIRVNCVCPTWTDTPMAQQVHQKKPGVEQAMIKGIPMGRLARAEEVADVALFLCSKSSSFMTGTALTVDGGTLLPVRR